MPEPVLIQLQPVQRHTEVRPDLNAEETAHDQSTVTAAQDLESPIPTCTADSDIGGDGQPVLVSPEGGPSSSGNANANTLSNDTTTATSLNFQWSTTKVATILAFVVTLIFGAGAWVGQYYGNSLARTSTEIAKYTLCADHEELRNRPKCKEIMSDSLHTLSIDARHAHHPAVRRQAQVMNAMRVHNRNVPEFLAAAAAWMPLQMKFYADLVDAVAKVSHPALDDRKFHSYENAVHFLSRKAIWACAIVTTSRDDKIRNRIVDETMDEMEVLYEDIITIRDSLPEPKREEMNDLFEQVIVLHDRPPTLDSSITNIPFEDLGVSFSSEYLEIGLGDILKAMLADFWSLIRSSKGAGFLWLISMNALLIFLTTGIATRAGPHGVFTAPNGLLLDCFMMIESASEFCVKHPYYASVFILALVARRHSYLKIRKVNTYGALISIGIYIRFCVVLTQDDFQKILMAWFVARLSESICEIVVYNTLNTSYRHIPSRWSRVWTWKRLSNRKLELATQILCGLVIWSIWLAASSFPTKQCTIPDGMNIEFQAKVYAKNIQSSFRILEPK